ncbi:MAG: glycosyltransferase family 2 protein [Bacteriovoracaceae bacterium]
MKLSVTIITYNEELNIAHAIQSALFADEIIIIDSFSTAKTKEICLGFGNKIKFYENNFLGYGQQKNFAANLAQGEWILNIDSDEIISEELKTQILNIINEKNPEVRIWKISRKNQYCGEWINYGGWSPDYQSRLTMRGVSKWSEPPVHEDLLPIDKKNCIGFLAGPLYHHSFPTFKKQVQTNVKYATLGANFWFNKNKKSPPFLLLLLKPMGKFIECYLLKLGILDGKRGLVIAINAAYSIFVKYGICYFDQDK